MTQISGKIYQMDNGEEGAQKELRFPRTVMEAVYGLNTYLQNQFSSLANIYMPIEGITESKPLQEFVYRLCPSSIKAKSVSLDRIYGKTLAWNQGIVQTVVIGSQVNQWGRFDTGITLTANGNELQLLKSSGYGIVYYKLDNVIVPGHKYYLAMDIKTTAAAGKIVLGAYGVDTDIDSGRTQIASSNWQSLASIKSAGNSVQQQYRITDNRSSGFDTVYAKNFSIVDLTLMFGAGNEPSTVAEFESMFPGYHDYSAGKLISNDAESMETVGFNQWDEELENGIYNNTTGQKADSPANVRCVNYVPVLPSTSYYYRKTQANGGFYIIEYDANKNFVKYTDGSGVGGTITTQSTTRYMTFYFLNVTVSFIKSLNICINLSDPAKNGTYEPYRKSVMQLGLNSIKVKSHNIWDEEWEFGQLDTTTGEEITFGDQIRAKNYISVLPGMDYYGNKGGAVYLFALWYDSSKQYISYSDITNKTVTAPSNASYMRFYTAGSPAYGTTYNNDICINVSSSFNGQYEPHGILTKTGGLKGKGAWRDEWVGNKFIQRSGYKRVVADDLISYGTAGGSGTKRAYTYSGYITDAKDFGGSGHEIGSVNTLGRDCKDQGSYWIVNGSIGLSSTSGELVIGDNSISSLDGFKALCPFELVYELDTPIEYELVSPLVPTVKAGTTEARISPNADGLSAPMVADMTYDAQANNDSASAQYALTAGRLLNSHKLWGQDFDGTQDVEGALTGVTTLTASGAVTAGSFVKTGGTASQFLKADGTVDSTAYLPLSGGILTALHSDTALILRSVTGANGSYIGFQSGSGSDLGWFGYDNNGIAKAYLNNNPYAIFHAGNSNKSDVNWACNNLSAAGNSTLDGTVRIGGSSGITLTYVSANNGLNFNKGIYSDSYGVFAAAASSSDQRLKDSISPVWNALDVIMALKPSEWTWNDKHSLSGQKGAGLVAQDVESVLPFAVNRDTEYLALNYNVFHAYEIAGLQNHEERIKALEAENAELRRRLGA